MRAVAAALMAKTEAKLSNEAFLSRAPEEVVAKEKDKAAGIAERNLYEKMKAYGLSRDDYR